MVALLCATAVSSLHVAASLIHYCTCFCLFMLKRIRSEAGPININLELFATSENFTIEVEMDFWGQTSQN